VNRQEARQELERQVSEGLPSPEESPTKLHLAAIGKAPELFQFRAPTDVESRQHIHEMSRSVNEGKTLDAILVWWGGHGWYCIDGHHRLGAYAMGNWDESIAVPVIAYKGIQNGPCLGCLNLSTAVCRTLSSVLPAIIAMHAKAQSKSLLC